MQSVMQAAWLLNVAFGNLIVTVVAKAKLIPRQVSWTLENVTRLTGVNYSINHCLQSMEFFLFAGLIALDIILFVILAVRYTYVEEDKEKESNKKKSSNSTVTDGTDNHAFHSETSM